ncbi:hypothetical protein [Oceanibaculum pacificum]|uniref:Nickel/cobalt efflux system n=1 Tax=Oceanibaculum pacificum TaxID=580166 RepID=A0A154VYA5_9PROT|nr:hypothetical protein [Oceanibaculum pacificum]KZD06201.1 hypothetical protein AUP43_11185 [Oceanibaculum pacificum]
MELVGQAWALVSAWQREILAALSSVLRTGDMPSLLALGAGLGALHALTPGHGKLALAAFLADSRGTALKGLRIAALAALMHVATGAVLYAVFTALLRPAASLSGRGEPMVTTLGYGLVALAGALMVLQAFRPHDASRPTAFTITAGIGVLPSPLTITVLGFALAQASMAHAAILLMALALGVAATLAAVALMAVFASRIVVGIARQHAERLEHYGRYLQAGFGCAVIVLAALGGFGGVR